MKRFLAIFASIAMLVCLIPASAFAAQTVNPDGTVTEDFEGATAFAIDEPYNGFTFVSNDEGFAAGIYFSFTFPFEGLCFAYTVFGPTENDQANGFPAHSGDLFMAATYKVNSASTAYVPNDSWLISPKLPGIAQTISFYVCSCHSGYIDTYKVMVSETDTELDSFSVIKESAYAPTSWTKVTVDLPEGTRYFAIVCDSIDGFIFGVDDITYLACPMFDLRDGSGPCKAAEGFKYDDPERDGCTFLGWSETIDGELIDRGADDVYTKDDFTNGTYYAVWGNDSGSVIVTQPLDFTGAEAPAIPTGSGITWDAGTKTLTLENAAIIADSDDALILPDGAVLEIIGDNTVVSEKTDAASGHAICAAKDMTIMLGGTLNCEASYIPIFAMGDISIVEQDIDAEITCSVGVNGKAAIDCGGEGAITFDLTDDHMLDITGASPEANEDGSYYAIVSDELPGTVTIGFNVPASYTTKSEPRVSVRVNSRIENGTVNCDADSIKSGETVTFSVTPDKGFTLETLNVTDARGNEIDITLNEDGTFSFEMPSVTVNINATFMENNAMLNWFIDVTAADDCYDAVLWAAENGITRGTDSFHFSPDEPTTRAQMLTFLWRAAGCPEVDYEIGFEDVSEGAYYAAAVRWAASKGITKGTTETTFSPDEKVTPDQAKTFVERMGIEVGEADTDVFADSALCTRAQAVMFLYKYFGGK